MNGREDGYSVPNRLSLPEGVGSADHPLDTDPAKPPESNRRSQLSMNGHADSCEVPNRQSLAERRGSVDLHLNTEPTEPLAFTRDTLPKSSEPLLGQRFFSDSSDDCDQADGQEQQTEVVQNIAYGSISPEPGFGHSEHVAAV